jgi:hypothetical protein
MLLRRSAAAALLLVGAAPAIFAESELTPPATQITHPLAADVTTPSSQMPLAELLQYQSLDDASLVIAPQETLPAPVIIEAPPAPAFSNDPLADAGEVLLDDAKIICLDGPLPESAVPELHDDAAFTYNATLSTTTWIPGSDDDFGLVSLEDKALISFGQRSGVVFGWGFHFLDGPVRTEMPPRLYDFIAGYQRREWIRPNFGWDFAFRVGAFGDFEGSAKKGVRFPSHLVTYLRLTPTWTTMLGVDYLDRDDITLLPVFGAIWMPTDMLRFDLAFPRPRVAIRVMDDETWIYLGGELGGSTWAIERDGAWNDNATYSDLRLVFGIDSVNRLLINSSLELGYVFARDLSYRSGLGDYEPDDALMIRLGSSY